MLFRSYYIQRFYYTCENVTFFLVEMCKHRVRFVQYVGEGNGKASSRKHWNSYDVRIRSTSRAVFFLKLGCLSGCFDRILLLSAGFLHTNVPVLLGKSFLIQFPHLHNLPRHTPLTERNTLCFGTHICTLLFLPTVRPHQNP